MIDSFLQDLTYALRGLRARPAFTTAIILTLALGIGANAAMFSLVDRMLFRPPPLMKDPASAHRVYGFETYRGKERVSFGGQYARYVDLTKWTKSFERTAGFAERDLAVGIGDAAREMRIGIVSASFFSFFDAPPALGRYFLESEDTPPEGARVAVASYARWQTEYGGRKDIIGTKVQIGPDLYEIIGVSAAGLVGLWPSQPPAYFIPITAYGATMARGGFLKKDESWWTTYHWGWMQMMARTKAGVSDTQANADLTQAFIQSLDAERATSPRNPPTQTLRPRAQIGSILSERGPNASGFAKVAAWLGGVAAVVLLIACANVANLLLARALRRRREIAVRLALGASRGRLLSQLLTESVLLALLGGVAGVFVAQWSNIGLRSAFLPNSASAPVLRDQRTILFAGVAAILAGLLTGLAPIVQASRADLTGDLKSGAREGMYQRSRLRAGLLLMQGALSVLLLVGAGLFVRSLNNVRNIRLGFDADPVLVIDLNMRGVQLDSAQEVDLRRRLMERAQATPNVQSVTLQIGIPFWSTWSMGLYVSGIDTVARLGRFDLSAVSPDYFTTMGTRILRGRGILPTDLEHSPLVMVVSQAMAKTLWPNEDAIGKCVRMSADTNPCRAVVGIAEDIKSSQLSKEPDMYYYLPATQFNPNQTGLFVRVRGDAAEYADAVRRALQKEMPGASYITTTPLSQILGEQTRSWRLGASMFTAFGLLALLLAAIGLYSVIAYNVAQRTHELGVRMALGAQAADVIRLVVREGMGFGIAGVVIGGGIALGVGRWLAPLLFDVSPRDPLVFVVVALTLLLVALAASWLPARRASRVEPTKALRYE
ncbi:MAG TPA: ABC transporter permease [Gemmatimonadaceae bacterium]|jgi:predicted permease